MRNKGDSSRQRTVVAILVVAFLLLMIPPATIGGAADEHPPPLPASYYGEVWFQDEPAPAGVTVEAEIDGEVYDTIITTSPGTFGGPALGDDKLTVNATETEVGDPVRFYVVGEEFNRTEAAPDEEIQWGPGDLREVNLTVDVAVNDTAPDGPSDESTADNADDNTTGEDDAADDSDDGVSENADVDGTDSTSSDTDDGVTAATDSQDEATGDDAETTGWDTTSDDDASSTDASDNSGETADEGGETSDSVPGFGIVLTLVALLSLCWQSSLRRGE